MSQRGSDDTQRQGLVNDRRFTHRAGPSVSLSLENDHSRTDGIGGPSYEDILLRTDVDWSGTQTQPERQSEATDVVPPSAVSAASTQRKPRKLLQLGRQNPPRPRVYIARRPPTSAALLPENRYCSEDELVKPSRAHHCRHCGTVSHFYYYHICCGTYHRALVCSQVRPSLSLWVTIFRPKSSRSQFHQKG